MTFATARRKLYDAAIATRAADDRDRYRAAEAFRSLGNGADPDRAFVRVAFLSLLHRGVRPTESNILEESKALFRANEAFHAERRVGRTPAEPTAP